MLEYYKKNRMLKELEARLPAEVELVKNNVRKFLEDHPSDTQALMILVHCQLLNDQSGESKQTLESLIGHDPFNVPAKVELARLLFKEQDARGAIELLTQVTESQPELTDNWLLLNEHLLHDGQEQAAKNAMDQYDMIKAFNDNLRLAEQAFANNEFVRADNLCRKLLGLVPNEFRTLRLLAKLAKHFGHYEISNSILARCIETRPADVALGLDYARSLLSNHKTPETLEQCQRLKGVAPESLEIYEIEAETLYNLGRYDEAIAMYRELAAEHKNPASCLMPLGKVLTTVGETHQAIACFHEARELASAPGQAWWELANLKTYRFSQEEIASMQGLLRGGELTTMDKVFVQFALGKALEDAQQYEQSFRHYQAANRNYGDIRQYRYSRQNARFRSVFTTEYFDEKRPLGNSSDAPIFVLGLPRSGSTLVEQILTSHSMVDSTTEIPEITSMARELNVSSMPGQGQYPQSLAKLDREQIRDLAMRYLDFVQPYRQQATHFVDKLPGKFHHVGLIKTLFPDARIIDTRRSPMASGWSLYKHFFAGSFGFSYDLVNIGRYYNDYVELMDHWHTVLPGQILTIKYEELIRDPRGTVESILQYCGLPFEDACVDFHQNKRAVATPGSEQVRQPVYDSAVEQWKNYEEFLTPLKQLVRDNDVSPAS